MALILIADDDPLNCEIVRCSLEARGHVVGSVNNGLDALKVVEAKHPDLVILDCAMHGLGGIEVLRRIRLSRTCFSVPVVMLTARSGREDEEIALRAGADEYLRKPIHPAELMAIVDLLLSRCRRGRSIATRL